jgi:thiamine biosynthesis lipoprotein
MGKSNNIIISFILSVFFLVLSFPIWGQQKYVFRQPKMGSPFVITIYGKDSAKIACVAAEAFKKIDTLNRIFSDYLDSSELNELGRSSGKGKYVPVSAELFNILQLSLKASRLSKGSFDITVGPVVHLWRKARRSKSFPKEKEIKKAMKAVGFQYIHLDTTKQAVWLEKHGMQLDLGGIAKGYAAQSALNFICKKGFPVAMVDAGGDLALGNPPSGREGWRIAISIPESKTGYLQQMLSLKNKAVATSGDVYQYIEWKGKRYSHIIDPKTGYGVTHQRNVTVIANNGATADWLASACSILPVPAVMKLINKFPGAAVLIAEKRGNTIYKKMSDKFRKYMFSSLKERSGN